MKKLIVIAVFVAAFLVTEKAQAQLNISVGYSPELMTTKTPTHDTTFFYHGVQFGLSWEFTLSDALSLTAGAQYRMCLRDHSEHINVGSDFVHHVTREQQTLIDLPIFLYYKKPLSEHVTLSPFVGPMLSWGITGKTTEQWLYPINTATNHSWYGDTGFRNRFNVYGVAGVKLTVRRFTFSLGGRYGFLNLENRITGTTTHAYGFFLTFGHNF